MLSTRVLVRLAGRKIRTWSGSQVYKYRQLWTTIVLSQNNKGTTLQPQISTRNVSEGQEILSSEFLGRQNDVSIEEIGLGITDVLPETLDQLPATKCGGCGIVLQSEHSHKPGYIIAAKNPGLNDSKRELDIRRPVVCERCFNLQHYNKALPGNVHPGEITDFLGHIARRKALILYVIDVTDLPGSMVPGLLDIVGPAKRIIIVGNKLDIMPLDGKPRPQLEKLTSSVLLQCRENGLQEANIKGICLISAQTGFGISQLIDKILKHWDGKGDIYLIGSNNSGKTSLFNTLLDLTTVHKEHGNMLQRATVSQMPGTTLGLLRFGFGHWKMMKLKHRLSDGTSKKSHQFNEEHDEYEIDPDIIDAKETEYNKTRNTSSNLVLPVKTQDTSDATINVYKPEVINSAKKDFQAWFYDTPGIINENQITNYLSMEELKLLHSNLWIVPRTFVLKPGQTFLLGGLARVDFVEISRMALNQESDEDTLTEANKSIYFTVFTSSNLPIHVLSISRVQEVYDKHAGNELLVVPCGGRKRMESFPVLESRDFSVRGIGWKESAGDIVLSNIGWVSVTAGRMADVLVRAYTPHARGLVMRKPALLPTSVNQRGKRGVSYQGHQNSSGYGSYRKKSPQLVKLLSYGHHGVYQWMREAKRKKKEQRALIKDARMKKILERNLGAGDPASLIGKREIQNVKKDILHHKSNEGS